MTKSIHGERSWSPEGDITRFYQHGQGGFALVSFPGVDGSRTIVGELHSSNNSDLGEEAWEIYMSMPLPYDKEAPLKIICKSSKSWLKQLHSQITSYLIFPWVG